MESQKVVIKELPQLRGNQKGYITQKGSWDRQQGGRVSHNYTPPPHKRQRMIWAACQGATKSVERSGRFSDDGPTAGRGVFSEWALGLQACGPLVLLGAGDLDFHQSGAAKKVRHLPHRGLTASSRGRPSCQPLTRPPPRHPGPGGHPSGQSSWRHGPDAACGCGICASGWWGRWRTPSRRTGELQKQTKS